MGSLSQGRSFSPLRATITTPVNNGIKLEHVTEKFANLWTDLEQEKQNRRLQDQTRLQMFAESIARLEKSLEAEVKRRAESDKQLQSHFEGELRVIQERSASQGVELQTALKSAVDSLTSRMGDLANLIKEEREQRRHDVEHLATSLVGKVNECVTALDDERTMRQQEQTMSIKRIGEDLITLQQRIDTEKMTRENTVTGLRSEIHEVLNNRSMGDEQFKAATLNELADIQAALAKERQERIEEDDEIVQAVNDYTRALQEGLKIVNS